MVNRPWYQRAPHPRGASYLGRGALEPVGDHRDLIGGVVGEQPPESLVEGLVDGEDGSGGGRLGHHPDPAPVVRSILTGLGVVAAAGLVTWLLHLAGWGKPSGPRPESAWDWRVRDTSARTGHAGCLGCRIRGPRRARAGALAAGPAHAAPAVDGGA